MRGVVVVRSTEEKEDDNKEDEFWRHAPGEKGRQPLTRFLVRVSCVSTKAGERERKRGFAFLSRNLLFFL